MENTLDGEYIAPTLKSPSRLHGFGIRVQVLGFRV